MKTAIIIPARYASSRLPAKPLLRETGKYLIQHVYERACESAADIAVVATDDRRIFDAVQSFGGHVVMTSPKGRRFDQRVAHELREKNWIVILCGRSAWSTRKDPPSSPAGGSPGSCCGSGRCRRRSGRSTPTPTPG